ncbi:Asp-tRNA(Asn)/Glu-tRNA(Gln) amidotransferase subunit GatA [Candidatus Anaplasma sp. TIGMIC]|uniref:Asp-tRNA(Asn)/Glu-tRNA(Gln) amidotransferase subunit GatA n=1 Tax=Candidatus Anaplasma sp. TIGMIC TaxID=3020713 RepID=UPI00232B22F4|nr:Asp-tRNA(Asn)/Glu-tRNA(Gln) amidotransferase subunit GatA [Candidatus Anaplasma sp. TIGMIC]MDB1135416.1 Asp-tRNA(Asn)/Glu-tRNA(Gln) amidotransferase subunit GatA [Candidatus Anaplasma sp. TIGMIC]
MKEELLKLSMLEAHRCMKKGEFSASELVGAYIERMESEQLNAFVTKTPELALERAKKIDELLLKGEPIGPLAGMPIGVKDLFCTKGVRTTACSKILQNFVPTYESTVTHNLWNDGAVMLGKLNMDEFAMGSANSYSCFGPVKNPWKGANNEELTPGGSSGGSSAAVSGLLCIAATGSDTGGSVRQPAALCGIVGAKPTYGRCSRWGMIAFASSLDQAGVLTRTVEDAAMMLQSMCGYDQKDSTSSSVDVPNFMESITYDIKGKRIGIAKEYIVPDNKEKEDASAMLNKCMGHLRDCGAEIIDISLPHTKYALPVYYVVASSEASSNLARYDGVRYGARAEAETVDDMYELTRSLNFGEEVKRRILIGGYALSFGCYEAYYEKSQKVRQCVMQDFDEAFKKVDYILALTTPRNSVGLREELGTLDRYYCDIFTVPASLAGLPAISVPSSLSSRGLPMSVQVIGKHYDEGGILNVAAIIHKNSGDLLKHLHGF